MSGQMIADGDNNRTLLDLGSQGLMNLYHPINKQMSVVPSTSGKGWTCKEYCPIEDGDYPDPLKFDPSAKDLGKMTVNGKTYEHYQWFDSIFKIVHMDTQDWLIDTSGSSPVPYRNTMKLTPFGGAEIATEGQVFDSFKAGKPDPNMFLVDNLDSCEQSQNCNQNNNAKDRFHLVRPKSLHEQAQAKARTVITPVNKRGRKLSEKEAVVAANWPRDWSAMETVNMVINQGGMPNADDTAVCCSTTYGGQCQVQQQYQKGQKYYDYSNNRTRFEDPVNGIMVDLYDAEHLKSMLVQHNGTHDVCVKYCPIDPRDTMDLGKEYFLDDNATDLGTTTWNGQKAEHWQWKQTIFKVVTMQTSDFYAAVSGSSVTPLGRTDHLTPFGGPEIGQGNVTYGAFKAAKQPAEKFDIQGVDSCPQDPQCGQQSRQLHRYANGQMHTFARYMRV
jgi:hypothetical protein